MAEGDVRRDEIRDRRIGAAEQEVLGRALEVVVLDQIRAGAVVAADRLRVLADGLALGDVGVDDRRVAAVQRDAPLLAERRITVDVHAIDDEGIRHLRELRLRGVARAERDDVAVALRVRLEFQEQELVVVRRRRRVQRRDARRRLDLRQQRRIRRRHADSGPGQLAVGRRRSNRDEVADGALVRQHEIAGIGRARRERDHVARLRRVEGRLQIAACGDRDRRGGGDRSRRQNQRTRGQCCPVRGPRPHLQNSCFVGKNLARAARTRVARSPSARGVPLRSSRKIRHQRGGGSHKRVRFCNTTDQK